MEQIVFATNNQHKLKEIRSLIRQKIEILSLSDIGFTESIPEEQPTIEGNSSQKAFYLYQKTGFNCFADDTGLEVEALEGEPGVYSARFAALKKNKPEWAGKSDKNIDVLLDLMRNESNRKARFKTVITLIKNGIPFSFEGIIKGQIITERSGKEGFGYDPIFIPEGYKVTFAEMNTEEKNKISHRGIAMQKLVSHLFNY